MKKLYILLLFLASNQVHSQNTFVPPGTIKVNDTLFIDKAPVDNLMFLEFIDQVQRIKRYHESAKLKTQKLHIADLFFMKTLLNPSRTREIYEQIELIKSIGSKRFSSEKYLEHPNFDHHPALFITKEMAEFYCEWRTKMVSLLWAQRTIETPNIIPPKINYRLPKLEEFELSKDIFVARSKLKILKKSSLLKMKYDRKQNVLVFFNLPEYTSGPKQHIVSQFGFSEDDPVLFRCVCEYEEQENQIKVSQ